MSGETTFSELNRKECSRVLDVRPGSSSEPKPGGGLGKEELGMMLKERTDSAAYLEELISTRQVSRHEVLDLLSEHYGVPFLEYDEMLLVKPEIIQSLDLDQLLDALWFPISVRGDGAYVIACSPRDPAIAEAAKEALNVAAVQFLVALPSDIRRTIENHRDINPGFPPSAGRTALARLRTWLADQRTLLAQYRTSLAKGRTGLAFMRTGLSFMSIALVFFRIFGIGMLNVPEALLLAVGMVMAVDGLIWYLPARKVTRYRVDYVATEPTFGTTVLELLSLDGHPSFRRTQPIEGAEDLRLRWNRLTPVMKRRFLAIDRTDLAEERTILANYRTIMGRARTALAFTRTGIAFIGLGIALLRQFPSGLWNVLDYVLIVIGTSMTLEGFHWYLPGRRTTRESAEAIKRTSQRISIWDFMFRPFHKQLSLDDLPPTLTIKGSHAPGIYGTTGLALERTLIADRRNVKSRLRTIMARSRTGMSFIRTGSSLFSVGLGLQVYFGSGNVPWTLLNFTLMLIGTILVADGFYWHLPAERTKRQFPYCFADMEIMMPDYARPASLWKKVVFSHEDI